MEVQTIQKFLHTTPRKLRLVADMVRKMQPEQAITTLRFTQKAAASELIDAISTALANARMKGISPVGFKALEINEGPKMRRFKAGARGRVKPYKRRMAHIKIVLSDEVVVEERVKHVKTRKSAKVANEEVKVEAKEAEKVETVEAEATDAETPEITAEEVKEEEKGEAEEAKK